MSWNSIHKTMTGYDFKKEFSFKDLFSFSFKKRKDIKESGVFELPRPWMWVRVLALFGILIVVNFLVTFSDNGVFLFPYFSFLVATTIPVTILTFLFEVNPSERLNILDLLLLFIIGTILAIVSIAFVNIATGILVIDPLIVSAIEETVKIALIFLALKFFKVKTIGLAFMGGFALGAGFQVVEAFGYSTCFGIAGVIINNDIEYSTMVDFLIFSFGSHALWGAIEAFAIIVAMKDTYTSALGDKRFCIWVTIPLFGNYLMKLIAAVNIPEFLQYIFSIWIQLGFIVLLILLLRVIIQSNLKPKEIISEEANENKLVELEPIDNSSIDNSSKEETPKEEPKE